MIKAQAFFYVRDQVNRPPGVSKIITIDREKDEHSDAEFRRRVIQEIEWQVGETYSPPDEIHIKFL